VNLFYLFDFVLPAVSDYGVALKLGHFEKFREALLRVMKFYLSCRSNGTRFLDDFIFVFFDLGSVLYQRVIIVSYRILEYWEEHKLPIFDMHRSNVTFFSEESGEIALSVLALSFPSNQKGSLEETRRYIFHFRLYDNLQALATDEAATRRSQAAARRSKAEESSKAPSNPQ